MKFSDNLREKIGMLFEKLELPGKDNFMTAHKGFTKMVIEEVRKLSSWFDNETMNKTFENFPQKVSRIDMREPKMITTNDKSIKLKNC